MTEKWKPLPGNWLYDLSTLGRVRSWAVPGGSTFRRSEPKILALSLKGPKGKQYLGVTLKGGVQAKVHRLVLETFVGPRPEGAEACHNNGDKLDNRLTNLRWDTPGANARDKLAHGTNYQRNKTHCPAGHEYTDENTYGGAEAAGRRCKECARARARAQYAAGYMSPGKRGSSHGDSPPSNKR